VVDNSIDYVIAFYAVWKVGGIVVALNPQAKFYEIEKLVRQCQAKCLLIDKLDENVFDQFQSLDIRLLSLTDTRLEGVLQWRDALDCDDDNHWYDCDESTLAQIIYTSGTTGNSKGVLLSHGNLMCNVRDIVSYLELDEHDSILNVLPFHYSYGNSVLHTHLAVGAKVVMAGSMAFPQDIVNSIRKYAVSGFSGVPSTYSLLLSRSDWASDKPPLRYITQAGGPMGVKLTEQLLEACRPETRLFIMYGQTEASARISWLPPERLREKSGAVGIPVAHVEMEIRNEQGEKLAAHQKGEVYVRGPSIMQGYWENPAATEQVLKDGWLKTGDLGHLDEDGYLFLEGRNSEMIKVGAHRINPLELEEVINKLPFINESAVIGVDDELLGQKLRAFVVGEESRENLFALKKHCNEFLPAHKIPREIKWLPGLPKTASGKIKRYQLNNS
jgi:acyl-CoA synthetase (AMP-forming)/AMP-acid ligase II